MGIIGHNPVAPDAPAVPGVPDPGAPGTPTTPAAPAHHEPGKARRFFEQILAFLLLPFMLIFGALFWVTRNNRAWLFVLIGSVVGIAVAFMVWVWRWFRRERHPVDHPVAPAPPADPAVYHCYNDAYGHQWQWPAGATVWQRWNKPTSTWV